MPYKHIAAHLNKTELACRLHYHQISHGSNRRKRNLSCSSVQTDYSHLFRERSVGPDSRMSPSSQLEGMVPSPADSVRLPSIMGGSSPQLPALLPKPNAPSPPREPSRGYPDGQRMLPNFEHHNIHRHPLKLDTSSLPSISTPSHNANHIDLARLHAIYAAHRNTFWAAIASEYGHNAAPSTLEKAWKSGRCCSQQNQSPITPGASPISETKEWSAHDKTSISSILGPDAGSRSAWDRDMIRKMEIN